MAQLSLSTVMQITLTLVHIYRTEVEVEVDRERDTITVINPALYRGKIIFTPSRTNTRGAIWTGVVAAAAHDLPLAHERSCRVDAVEPGAARLGQSNTLVNV